MVRIDRKRELICLLPLLFQWLVFFLLKDKLPEQIATHFTIKKDGSWVANGFMSPWQLILFTVPIYGIVWLSFSRRSQWIFPGNSKFRSMWLIKIVLLLFVAGLNTVLMINAAGKKDFMQELNTPVLIGLLLLLNVFIFFIFRYGMGDKEQRPLSRRYYNIIWTLMHLLVNYIILVPLLKIGGSSLAERNIGMEPIVLAILAITGNLTYNIKPNYFIGIRNPWTLGNEMVWKKTHQLAGILLFITGIAGFVLTLLLPRIYHSTIMICVLITGLGIPFLYSYFLHRQLTATTDK